MSRWVVVDDTSSNIVYDETWTLVNDVGINGAPDTPLYNTLHGAQSEAGIVFEFEGMYRSSVIVIGSQFDASSMPQWSCFVDGQPIDQSSNETVGNGQLELCSKANVLDGMHKLVVNVSATEDTPFWFDYIEYLPSAGSLNQTDAVYGWDDPMIECDSTWDKKKDWTMTTTTGSMMSFDFNGASLTWFGIYDNNHSRGLANATYSVDGESPIPFFLNNTSTDDRPLLVDQQFFQTSNYMVGDHKLEVMYYGDSDSTPLTLEKLIVQDSSTGAPATSSSAVITSGTTTPSATSTSPPTPSPTGNKVDSRMIASIVGGAIGGFLFLVFVVIIFILLRRCSHRGYRRNGHEEENFRDVVEPYTHNPLLLRPSNYDPLPTSSKRPIELGNYGAGNGPLTPGPRPRDSRRSIMRMLVDSLGSANFGSSSESRRVENSSLRTLLTSTSGSSYSHTRDSSSWVVVHEDSGVRLLPQGQEVVEIPPTYSAR